MTNLIASPDSNLHVSPTLNGLLDGQVAAASALPARPLAPDPGPADYLVITETTPQSDISVRLTRNSAGKLVPSFSSDGETWFSAGIEWRPATKVDTALFITFSFVPPSSSSIPAIKEITCPYFQVAYGPAIPTTGTPTSQMISVLSSGEPIDYSFRIRPEHGQSIDPKIKITPP